jgi:hypothetical protein
LCTNESEQRRSQCRERHERWGEARGDAFLRRDRPERASHRLSRIHPPFKARTAGADGVPPATSLAPSSPNWKPPNSDIRVCEFIPEPPRSSGGGSFPSFTPMPFSDRPGARLISDRERKARTGGRDGDAGGWERRRVQSTFRTPQPPRNIRGRRTVFPRPPVIWSARLADRRGSPHRCQIHVAMRVGTFCAARLRNVRNTSPSSDRAVSQGRLEPVMPGVGTCSKSCGDANVA